MSATSNIVPPRESGVNWSELRRTIESAQERIVEGAAIHPDDARRKLRQRARLLSRTGPVEPFALTEVDVLVFQLSGERYALETRHVRGVHVLKNLIAVPCTPRFVIGIVNVQGHVLPVLDLKVFFELPERGLSDLNRIIVVEGNGLVFCLLADAVVGTRHIPLEGLQPSLPTLTAVGGEYLKGVTPDCLIVLDMARILADPRIIVHEVVE